ncbi:MAG: bifunctional 4-hydroxy-2-oxoglutarate aldolase/2-dehydro-3-deoxy-phosphogluconate aldolase [Treponema sp.]|nr:bifunctional 4-hydroxy-2-oxoglutarate aldolase/2-dehydro-3-deoxy-phosphogluconate aldolase [Treponema sp.]
MNEIFELMEKSKIIPVTTIADAECAAPVARALFEGGIKIIEITYRTAAASKAISAVSAECPEILAGAGTVTEVSQAKEAIACGAKFIVSPGTNLEIVEYCKERGIAVIPGVATPTEIARAALEGCEVLKFFPAEILGGPAFLDAMKGPFPQIKFVPTGGISEQNAPLYLKKPNVLAVGGSWLVKNEFIEARDWNAITSEAKKASAIARA